MKNGIAYIDDSKLNLDCIKTVLGEDFKVDTFLKPEVFLEKYSKSTYAAILLDVHMPTLDGFDVYQQIVGHPHYNGCPILFISSDDNDGARIKSFGLGAVDFISRMIKPDEMIARVKSRIQFFQLHRNIIEFGTLRLNLTLFKALVNDIEVRLTFIELKILCHVLRNFPEPITKEQLVQHVWQSTHVLDATIYTHVSNLNHKLETWDHEIQVKERGKGFQVSKKDKK